MAEAIKISSVQYSTVPFTVPAVTFRLYIILYTLPYRVLYSTVPGTRIQYCTVQYCKTQKDFFFPDRIDMTAAK